MHPNPALPPSPVWSKARRGSRPASTLVRLSQLLILILTLFLPASASAQDPRSELIDIINTLRAGQGLPPYTVDPGLMAMAQEHSQYQASIHKSTHLHSDGRTPGELGIVENVAGGTYGFVTPHTVVYNIWVDPGHWRTLVGYPAGSIGVGVADDGLNTYYTLELVPAGAALSSPPAAGTAPADIPPLPLVALTTVTPLPDGSIYHIVGYGQSLWALALAYGVTLDQLRSWNNLPADSSEIYAGQRLLVRLPGAASPPATPPPAAIETRTPPAAQPGPGAGGISPTPDRPALSEIASSTPSAFLSASPAAGRPSSTGRVQPWLLPLIAGICILLGVLLLILGRRRL